MPGMKQAVRFMKISIQNIRKSQEEQVIIQCFRITEKINGLIRYIKSEEEVLLGYEEEKIVQVPLQDIYFMESVDNKVFAYSRKHVYELKYKLYELEAEYRDHKFMRCSKSIIVNLMKIDHVKPMLNGRLQAKLFNDEEIVISRQYVPVLKKYLAGGKR